MSELNPKSPNVSAGANTGRARSIKEFCTAAGISLSHYYDLQRQGKIKSIRFGKRTVIPPGEYDRLMSEGVA
jgi:hypothetical protein